MEKITAIIPTFNEEGQIRKSLESVLWADEIIVVDSFSTDATPDIVNEYGQVRFIQHEYVNSTTQKNWIIPQAAHEWVFILDADEWIDDNAVEEIKSRINAHPTEAAFRFHRVNFFMDRKVGHVWQGDSVIRLFRKSLCRYETKQVHGEIVAQGKVGQMKHVMYHDTYRGKGYDSFMIKGLRYSTWSARDHLRRTRRVTGYHMVIKPAFTFFKHYFLKRGFLDGMPGFILSCLSSWNVFQRYIKVWRMHRGEEFRDINVGK